MGWYKAAGCSFWTDLHPLGSYGVMNDPLVGSEHRGNACSSGLQVPKWKSGRGDSLVDPRTIPLRWKRTLKPVYFSIPDLRPFHPVKYTWPQL